MKKITLLAILLVSIGCVLPVQAKAGSKDVNFTAVQPFHEGITVSIPDGSDRQSKNLYVEKGKQLVITHVSAYVDGLNDQSFSAKIAYRGGQFYLVFHYQMTWGSWNRFVASQPVRAYVNGPETIHCSIIRDAADVEGEAPSEITISGYLVDLPK